MVCSNCAKIIARGGTTPPHFMKLNANRATCPEPGGGKYLENLRKKKAAELPGRYRDTKRKLEDAQNTISKLQKDLDHERRRVHVPEDTNCPVCWEVIVECDHADGVGFFTPKCGHLMCISCYNIMIKRHIRDGGTFENINTNCPSCRAPSVRSVQ